jgi:hypothetical protein
LATTATLLTATLAATATLFTTTLAATAALAATLFTALTFLLVCHFFPSLLIVPTYAVSKDNLRNLQLHFFRTKAQALLVIGKSNATAQNFLWTNSTNDH